MKRLRKICAKCNIKQDEEEFYLRNKKTGNRFRTCRSCLSVQKKKYRQSPKGREVKLKYRQNHKAQAAKYVSKYYYSNKGREHNLKKRFGITLEEYNQMNIKQKGRCAICGRPETYSFTPPDGLKRIRALSIDHNHETNEIRGLLCIKCNAGIGNFDENIEYLANAIAYLQKAKEIKITRAVS